MASEEQYSSEFKAKVALEALAQNKENLDQLSDKYDVPVSVILTWTVQLESNAANVYATTAEPTNIDEEAEEDTFVDVTIDNEKVSHGISFGVMGDELDIKKLAFWSVLGIVFVIIFVQLLLEMHQMTTQVNIESLAEQTEYEVIEQKQEARERLTSFGVVNLEEGIYRIPIDSVINDMAVDGQ